MKADVFIKKSNRIKRIGPYKQILELDFITKKKKEKGKKITCVILLELTKCLFSIQRGFSQRRLNQREAFL